MLPEDIWWYAPPATFARAMPGEALVIAAVGMLRGSTAWASAAMAMVVLICIAVAFSREVPVLVAAPAAAVLLALLALAFRRLRGLADRQEPGDRR